MKRLSSLIILISLLATVTVPFLAPTVAYADKACPDGVSTAYFGCVKANRQSSKLEDNPIYKLLLEILKFLGYGVGIVVVGGISYGAFLIVNSNANAGRTQQGVSIIVNAFIGLLIYIFLFAIANYLIPGGIFT